MQRQGVVWPRVQRILTSLRLAARGALDHGRCDNMVVVILYSEDKQSHAGQYNRYKVFVNM